MHFTDIELNGIDEHGIESKYKLSDFKGKKIIVYFYPEDETPVCTKEAQEFRDTADKLNTYAKVIGVSKNSIQEHIEFQKKHGLNYILLSDIENKLKKAFENNNKYFANLRRATFILNEDGKIIKYWTKVDVDEHINEIIGYFRRG